MYRLAWRQATNKPGKKLWQFFTLPEAGLAHGEKISLFATATRRMPIAVRVEFENTGKTGDVWVYSPCLSKDARALSALSGARPMTAYYRHIPKTMQKLWKGETVNIVDGIKH